MKKLSFVLFGLAFILSSCTMDKRVYTSGYHIQWNTDVHSSSKQEIVKNTTPNKVILENKQVATSFTATEAISNNTIDKSEVMENNYIASTDNSVASTSKVIRNKNSVKTYVAKKIIENQIHKQSKKKKGSDTPYGVLIVLAIFLPPIAVGIVTNWDLTPVAINFLLCLLCFIPGIIHAIITVNKSK